MQSSANSGPTYAPMLVAINAASQVHLILGTNSLAAARCTKSLQSGAQPIIVASDSSEIHFSLKDRIEQGAVKWVRRDFQNEDLKTLGREDVDHVVDMVFITLDSENPLSMLSIIHYCKSSTINI